MKKEFIEYLKGFGFRKRGKRGELTGEYKMTIGRRRLRIVILDEFNFMDAKICVVVELIAKSKGEKPMTEFEGSFYINTFAELKTIFDVTRIGYMAKNYLPYRKWVKDGKPKIQVMI